MTAVTAEVPPTDGAPRHAAPSSGPDPSPGPSSRLDPSHRVATVIALAVIAVGLVGSLLFFGGLTIDDAFITWRYADNLVHHGIWNYNPSTIDLVEAYTNPSFAFLAILPAALGIPVEAFFKVFMGVLGIGFLIWLWRRPVPPAQRLVLVGLVAANPIMHIHWWSGLETGLWIMLLTIVVSKLHRTGTLGWGGTAGLLLIALTRPEGLGYLVVLLVWGLLLRRGRAQWLQTGLVLAVLGVYWWFRTDYFGRLLPNTFYAKTAGHAESSGLVTGGLIFAAIVVLTPLVVWLFTVGRGEPLALRSRIGELVRLYMAPAEPVDRARWTPVLLAVLAVGIQFVIYANSSLQMDYANRFAFQLVAPVILVCLAMPLRGERRLPAAIALSMLAVVVAVMQGDIMSGAPLALALLGLALVMLGLVGRRTIASLAAAAVLTLSVSLLPLPDVLWMSMYRARLQDTHVEVGKVLAKHWHPGATVVVHDAGVVPYEATGWEVIDVFGLATRRITDNQMSVDDLAAIDPDIVIADRFLGKRFLDTYGDRYDPPIEGSTIRLRKDVDPQLRADLEAVVAQARTESRLSRPRYVMTHSPSLEWLTGGTR